MAFNPADYTVERRISARHLGRQQPNYRVLSTGKDAGPNDEISDEVLDRMKNPSSTVGRKRKSASAGGQVETSSAAKRPRPSKVALRATSTTAAESTATSIRRKGKGKALPKTTSARRTSKKKDLAKDATEQEQMSGVLSPPETPVMLNPSETQEDKPRDQTPESPDTVAPHERPEEQLLTPGSSRGQFETPLGQGPANHTYSLSEKDSPTLVITREAITALPNLTAATLTDVEHINDTSILPSESSLVGSRATDTVENPTAQSALPVISSQTRDGSVPQPRQNADGSGMLNLLEQSRNNPPGPENAKSLEEQAEANNLTPDTHDLHDDENAASVASSSSLSSPPSSIVLPQVYTGLLTEAIPSSARSQRNVRPIHRYGALVENPAEALFEENEILYESSAEEDGDTEESGEEQAAPTAGDSEQETDHEDILVRQQPGRRRKATVSLQSTSKRRKRITVDVPGTPSPDSTNSPSLIVKLPISLPATPGSDDSPGPKRKRAIPSSTARPKASRPQRRAAPPPAAAENEADVYPELDSIVDPKLVELSVKLTKREPLPSKPLPAGEPEVWADSRQALCETVPYFKKPQGGCHQNDRHTYAFLFDNVGHCREYMDSDVIIARAGGSMEFDSSTGGMIQKKDHLMSEAQVQSVVNDTQLKNPLIIICGDKNRGAVCKMPHRYNVLGWYKPINVWAEKTRGKGTKIWATIKYRFERLGSSAKAAWHETGSIEVTDEERRAASPLTRQTCSHCQHDFPMVYLVGWMCLNQDCPQFWKLPNGEDAGYGKLHYNPAFLLHRSPWPVEEEPFSVRPPIPVVGNVVGDNLTKINTRGICCPQCGRCSSRRLFKGWRCDKAKCDYENFPKHIPVKIPMLHQPWESTGDGPALARNKHEKGVKVHVNYIHGFKVYTYTFEGVNGKFVHATSNALINRQPGGADEMFTAIQNQDDPEMDMHLERRRFGIEKNSGSKAPAAETEAGSEPVADDGEGEAGKKAELEDGDFMTAFSMNYGMPYKFVASGASMSFTNAPWPVRACRADLNWASQTFLDKENHVDLNEELIFAYMEGQKIEYHDDGESGLGPRITTLSLGGNAKMHMRMKMKHYVGCSKTGILTADRPIPGSIDGPNMYQKRLEAWTELQALKDTNKPLYEKRRKEIPKELGLYGKRMKKAEDAVTITLNHGDIVAMEGYEIQQYLEHKVVPEGPLRFALTCRTVLPDHLKPEELPSYEVEADDESMSSLRKMAAAQG